MLDVPNIHIVDMDRDGIQDPVRIGAGILPGQVPACGGDHKQGDGESLHKGETEF
jgi:hypothetical protein